MMTEKASCFACKPVITTTRKSETSLFLDQPVENKVVEGDNPSATPSTSEDNEAAEMARQLELDETVVSPYACAPIAIDCGPGLATYCVPKHLLRSPKWSNTNAGGTLHLPGVSAATGHILAHYLYTGTYQSLEIKRDDTASIAHFKFEQALEAFALATEYLLDDLEGLAKEQIKTLGSCMALHEVLDTVRKCTWFSDMAWGWLHLYLQVRVKEQFDLDYRYFTSEAYIDSVGHGQLHRFIACHLVQAFTGKLTHVLHHRECHCMNRDGDYAVFDGFEVSAEPEPEAVRNATPHSPPEAGPEPVEELEVDPFAGLSKSQKKKLQMQIERKARTREDQELHGQEPLPPVSEPEPLIEPEPAPPKEEPEPIKELAVDPFAGLSKSQKKKLQMQMERKARMRKDQELHDEEPPPPVSEPESLIEPEPIATLPEAEAEPVKELVIDPFAGLSKLQKRKLQMQMRREGGLTQELSVEEPPPPPPQEPEPFIEPVPILPEEEPRPVEELTIDPFAGLSKSQKRKLQMQMRREGRLQKELSVEEPPPPPPP